MRLDLGTYEATVETMVSLMRSNSIGSRFLSPSTVNYRIYEAGAVFEIPASSEGFYYRTEFESDVRKVVG